MKRPIPYSKTLEDTDKETMTPALERLVHA